MSDSRTWSHRDSQASRVVRTCLHASSAQVATKGGGPSDQWVVSPSGRMDISLITESTLPDIAHLIARASPLSRLLGRLHFL